MPDLKGNIGHAALTITGAGGAYVSWWPKGSVKNLLYGPASPASGLADDIRSEGGPPRTLSLGGMNEARMIKLWSWWKAKLWVGSLFGPELLHDGEFLASCRVPVRNLRRRSRADARTV